jgi:hypothetical protein
MRESMPHSGSVRALREHERSPRRQVIRRIAFRALIGVTTIAALTTFVAASPRVRGSAAVVVVMGVVAAVIAWLTGASGRIQSSGKDPQDFTISLSQMQERPPSD